MLQLSTEFHLTLTAHTFNTVRYLCNSLLLVLTAPHKPIVSPPNFPFQIISDYFDHKRAAQSEPESGQVCFLYPVFFLIKGSFVGGDQ